MLPALVPERIVTTCYYHSLGQTFATGDVQCRPTSKPPAPIQPKCPRQAHMMGFRLLPLLVSFQKQFGGNKVKCTVDAEDTLGGNIDLLVWRSGSVVHCSRWDALMEQDLADPSCRAGHSRTRTAELGFSRCILVPRGRKLNRDSL